MSRVWKLNDNVNTDQIIPGRYYPCSNDEALGKYCLCELREDFAINKARGDIIVAGWNFGCGSSREYAALALKYAGVKCVIAKSFARIFYRNCINLGFPIIICEGLYDNVKDGVMADIDLAKGSIIVECKTYNATPLPEFVLRIAGAGGIVEYIKQYGIEALEK
jgi:3-isopropylmalate/(R)-2-methylmalate dehydratase small subunit